MLMRLIQSHKKGRIVCVCVCRFASWHNMNDSNKCVVHLCCRFMSRFFCRLLRQVWWFFVIWKSSLKIEDAQMDLPMFLPPFASICNDLLSLLTETRQGGMTNCVQIATKMKSTFLFALAEILWLESQVQHRLFWSRYGGKRLVDHCKVSKMTNGSLLLSNVHRIVRMLFVLLYLLSSLQDRVGRSKD